MYDKGLRQDWHICVGAESASPHPCPQDKAVGLCRQDGGAHLFC